VNDDQLIDETLAGNTAAFGDLVRKYQDRLFHSISHVLGSAQDAEDVVQESFVQAFLKLESFKRTAAFYTWVYRIAFNTAISLRRRKSARISIDHLHSETGEEPPDPGPPPDDRMRQQERSEQVQTALAGLAEEHRIVLVLREMDDLSYEAIAEILDVPVGTVRSRLHRARSQLKEHLKQVLQEDLTRP
jgi:RNA polymerase sigma-70 factor (ECF subfamily)